MGNKTPSGRESFAKTVCRNYLSRNFGARKGFPRSQQIAFPMAYTLGILAFSSIGPMELLVIFLVILLLFGAKRIPEIARGLGKGIREFKGATRDIADEINSAGREIQSASRSEPPSGTTPRSKAEAEKPTQTAD